MKLLTWQKEKPDFACAVLGRDLVVNNYSYSQFYFKWFTNGEGYYLAWIDADGCEWGDIADGNCDEYLILEILPTLEEIKIKKSKMKKKNLTNIADA